MKKNKAPPQKQKKHTVESFVLLLFKQKNNKNLNIFFYNRIKRTIEMQTNIINCLSKVQIIKTK